LTELAVRLPRSLAINGKIFLVNVVWKEITPVEGGLEGDGAEIVQKERVEQVLNTVWHRADAGSRTSRN